MIRTRARRLRDEAEDRLEDFQETVEEGYERAKASVQAGLDTARHRIDERRENAREAYDAGKAAVRSARDELETRLADARAKRGTAVKTPDDVEDE